MFREVKKKMVILRNRMPFPDKAKCYFSDTEMQDWIYTNMKLEGSGLSKDHVAALLTGEVIRGTAIGEHVMAQRLKELLDKMYEYASMNWPLDVHVIEDFHRIIIGEKSPAPIEYRRRNLIVQEYDSIPCVPGQIPHAMQQLQLFILRKKDVEATSEEIFDVAVKIHNSIIEIFPYGETDKILARAAMDYYLMLQGYPAGILQTSEEDYNQMVLKALKTGDVKELKGEIMSGILASLGFMIQLTDY